jgi:tripartite-type tricarboxylate transporter receptor subunit TctC
MREGALRALAVIGPQRWPRVPEGPALSSAGWGHCVWSAGVASSLPLAEKINAFVRDPVSRERLINIGLRPTGNTPDEFRDII